MNIRGFSHARITWNLDSSVYRYTIADGSWWIARAILHSSVCENGYITIRLPTRLSSAPFFARIRILFFYFFSFFFLLTLEESQQESGEVEAYCYRQHICSMPNAYMDALVVQNRAHARESREKMRRRFLVLFTIRFCHAILFSLAPFSYFCEWIFPSID